ncbi:MAG TPA: pyridoxal-phosphate dependent enzyme [archaeon]|nr:pyridoxal-phosphate dependent enzyme [archaeon]
MTKEFTTMQVSPEEARKAARHIQSLHSITPILPLETLVRDDIVIHLYGKFENVQALYTFKTRGSEWLVYNLMKNYIDKGKATDDGIFIKKEDKPVLVTASAGNHAQGVALAANRYGLEAVIYMPQSTPDVKKERVQLLGAKIELIDGVFDDSLKRAKEFQRAKRSRIFVHPYENPTVIAGQATVGVEIISQYCPLHPDYMEVIDYDWPIPDVIICGLGGGGLASGIGSVAHEFNDRRAANGIVDGRRIRVIGVQSEAADSMYRSFKAGDYRPSSDLQAKSVADGIAVKQASPRMIRTVKKHVDDVVLISEESIRRGIAYIAQHPKLKDKSWRTTEVRNPKIPFRKLPERAQHVSIPRPLSKVEGAGAAPYAAVALGDLHEELRWKDIAGGRKELDVVCVLTGANISDEKYSELSRSFIRPRNL